MVCLALGNFFLLSKRQRTPNGHQQGWHSHMRFMVGMIELDVPPIVSLEGQMGRVAAVDGIATGAPRAVSSGSASCASPACGSASTFVAARPARKHEVEFCCATNPAVRTCAADGDRLLRPGCTPG
jgi:hypothetical protein